MPEQRTKQDTSPIGFGPDGKPLVVKADDPPFEPEIVDDDVGDISDLDELDEVMKAGEGGATDSLGEVAIHDEGGEWAVYVGSRRFAGGFPNFQAARAWADHFERD